MSKFIILFLLVVLVHAGEVRYDISRFVEEGLAKDPQLAETKYGVQAKKDKIHSLTSEVILPTFSVSMMVGPAPGLRQDVDSDGDTVKVYDFSKMGPFWGVEAKFIQPLNFGQYRSGKKALNADLLQKTYSVEKDVNKKDVELQTYYFNYLLAYEMQRLANDAKSRVDKAYDDMEEALDDDDPGVSQMDFLNLKMKMHTVKEAVADADLGMKRIQLAIRFSLDLDEGDVFVAEDTILVPRPEPLLLLEEVKENTIQNHPELKQLYAGLTARRTQMELAKSRLAPEFFVMGEIEYVKSWAGNRSVMQKDAFAKDAVNKLDGLIGFGLRYNLNFWKHWENYRSARTEYRSLQLKDKYAADGLVARAEEQYYQVVAAKEKMEALRESLRASEAILKGAAMQYDLDKSNTNALVSAYTQNVSLQKDYYFSVCKYNVEFAELISRMGMTLASFRAKYMK